MLPSVGQGTMVASSGTSIKTSNNAFIVLNKLNVANNGTITQAPGDGTIKITGSVNTSTSGTGTTILDRVEIATDNGYSHTLATSVGIKNVLTLTSGQLLSNGFLTLRSDANTTARLAPVLSSIVPAISGNVTVERYIPGRRKYRLITSSVTSSSNATLVAGQEAQSIWGNWQNSGNNTAQNVGTIITGGTSADGFDTQTNNASLFTYNDSTKKYVAFSSPNGKNTKYTPLKASEAYYMFVYGDRINSVTTSQPNNTVMKASGTLLMGDQVYNTSSAVPLSNVPGRFSLVGNPYASPINWGSVQRINVSDTYWGWDPNLSNSGGYVTVHTSGTVMIISPISGTPGINQYIQPGQAFFVKTMAASPVLTIREQDKISTINNLAFNPLTVSSVPELAINLLYNNGPSSVLADGVVYAFDSSYPIGVGEDDAIKMLPANESISILNSTNLLSIDARPMPQTNDTLYLSLAKLTKPQYTLEIFGQEMNNATLHPFLYDKYLNTLQTLTLGDTNRIIFNVMLSDSASFNPNRFKIVFRSLSVLPITFESIKAIEINKLVKVQWEIAQVQTIVKYDIERSSDGIHFNKVGEIASRPSNVTAERYEWLDVQPLDGNNYYRIRSVESNGEYHYSSVVVIKMNLLNIQVSIYPNPVTNDNINVHIGSMVKGIYSFRLLNAQGQQVYTESLNHEGGGLNKTIRITSRLPAGVYYLQISNKESKNETVERVTIL